MLKQTSFYGVLCWLLAGAFSAHAQQKAVLRIDAAREEAPVAATLHGVFFEEISHGGEGGLYAELIQNRGFEDASLPPGTHLENGFIIPPRTPHFSLPDGKAGDWKLPWRVNTDYPAWHAAAAAPANLQLSLTEEQPLNEATPHSLKVVITGADETHQPEVVNDGFWGINIEAGEWYDLSFYMRTADYTGDLTILLKSADSTVLARCAERAVIQGNVWHKYNISFRARKTDTRAHFCLAFNRPGTVWLDFVSLFPQHTFKNRVNGLRKDLAAYIADLQPAFVRWPGGCFVEGVNIQSAPDWKQTIGPVEERRGTYSPWEYWTSNGFGYFEYLQFCEDIGAAALYVFNAGVSCDYRSGTFVVDDSLQPYIQNALDAIEYAIGPASSHWGKLRAQSGHPAPFPLKYVEVGNEQHGPRYAQRYNRFYKAIKEKYPQIQIVASMGIGDVNEYTLKEMEQVDIADEHAYKAAGWIYNHYNHFDHYPRGNWDLYVGEYATNAGVGRGNMEAALCDAIYIMSMEKNGDLVKMSSYAPLLVNTHDVDWPVNLINFDQAHSFARISYYAIQLMNRQRADVNLATTLALKSPAVKTPQFAGGVGLATWDTKTAYKDIEVIKAGKIIYQSDFAGRPGEWGKLRGTWELQDSALAQTAYGAQQLAMLLQQSFDTYTIKLKAKKLEGYNAFIIPFAIKDSNTFLRAHIGSWVNKNCVFERVRNGFEVTDITPQQPLTQPIETGRWYDIRLEVGLDTVQCFLDDQLIMTYTEPDKLFAIAGKDNKTGDLIVKMVNAYAHPMAVELQWQHLTAGKQATLMTLSAPGLTDENSYTHPTQFIPVTRRIETGSTATTVSLAPFSINVLRLSPPAASP